ncbi:TRAF3-interacting protein 1 isoform X1 [Oncorhynchus mykiss]|uniref:TRAF3-interacting protein 1 isoform X1 n=1 Tax=Oncorhynchus mykiss TaxID=8022 RepID=UPI000B4F2991|nr:TRAF3-interacting protein 1 isoform X1 [Oncorhynchus mykiss]XP_021434926.1 TRAF3-interacting protein 1 isoform X1 [Oncorhynchus mykiss]XP_036814841.1 TRAF3-interacting protein 1 isoform X1 [Oncorhynchus mykiss]
MNASMAKKTQDTLGKVIKKPPLTEKLLTKPPFRYLHDIFSEVIRTTGFMKGLYVESEMKSDNVKDKDAKMAFLQKAMDVVMLVSGEPLSAKPARIVAGHEPEKTNELLQAIAKCCLNKLSSEEAVKRVLAGDKLDPKGKASTSRSQDKENREGRERHRDREERKEIREHSVGGGREKKDPDQPKEQEDRRGNKEKEPHPKGERSEKARERDRTKDRDKDKSRDRERDKDKRREKDGERDKEREKDRGGEKSKDKETHRARDRNREEDGDRDKRREKGEREKARETRHKQGEEKTKVPEKGDKKARASEESKHRPHPEEPSKTTKPEPAAAEVTDKQSDSPARIPRPSSAKGQRRMPKAGAQQESDGEGDGDTPLAERPVPLENGDATDAVPAHMAHSNRRIPRPNSARPAPPRFKRQESYADVTPAERLTSAKPPAAVIMEGKKLSEDEEEDEDEQFVVQEAAPPPPDMPDMEMDPSVGLQGDEKHGGLVKKILETKKDFETSPSSPKSKDQTQSLVSEAARKKERELVSREIERLRSSIQTVCRSALPLGKIMDYIQEDMDAMQNELHTWRRENKEHAQALLQEQRVTDNAVEPLKAELAELEQLIKEQQDKICAVKSNVLKNEDKIQKMVTSINFSSRT